VFARTVCAPPPWIFVDKTMFKMKLIFLSWFQMSSSEIPQAIENLPTSGEEFQQQKITLDELGPVVVNLDGTMSRITNWKNMSKNEQDQTSRVIAKRNVARMEKLKQTPQ
jgi:hypothetical protein